MKNYVQKAILLAGSQTALATCCGVSQQSVWKWLQKGCVPPRRALAIERALNGRVTRYDLCPDIYPREVSDDNRSSSD